MSYVTCSPLPACVGRAAVVEEGSDGEVVSVAQLHQAHLVAPHVLVHRQDRVRVAVRIPKRELPPTTSCHRGAGWAGDRAKSIPGVIEVLFHIFDHSLPSSLNINFY